MGGDKELAFINGLQAAANECRRVARKSVPFTTWRWDGPWRKNRLSRSVNIRRRAEARSAIRCARKIEVLIEEALALQEDG